MQFWMTSRSVFGHFTSELSIKTLLGKVVREDLDNGTEVIQ